MSKIMSLQNTGSKLIAKLGNKTEKVIAEKPPDASITYTTLNGNTAVYGLHHRQRVCPDAIEHFEWDEVWLWDSEKRQSNLLFSTEVRHTSPRGGPPDNKDCLSGLRIEGEILVVKISHIVPCRIFPWGLIMWPIETEHPIQLR